MVELKLSGALTPPEFGEAGIGGLVYPLVALAVIQWSGGELLFLPSLCAFFVSGPVLDPAVHVGKEPRVCGGTDTSADYGIAMS